MITSASANFTVMLGRSLVERLIVRSYKLQAYGEDLLSLDLSKVSGSINHSNNSDRGRVSFRYYYGIYNRDISYKNIENVVITGTSYDDVFSGNTGDTLDGGNGIDVLNLDVSGTTEDLEINSLDPDSAAFAYLPPKRVYKEIEYRIIQPVSNVPRLSFAALIYLRALKEINFEFSVKYRTAL